MKRYDVGPMRQDEMDAVTAMVAWAFGDDLEGSRGWIERSGLGGYRVVRDGKEPVACLFAIPMGQYFGGRSVSMTGIAGVASAPEHRGKGAVRALMHATIKDLAHDRIPLSMLYPATRTLYRDAGYEPAGGRFAIRVDTAGINLRERALDVAPITAQDEPTIKALYRAKAALHNGHLDRGHYLWERIMRPHGKLSRGFLVQGPRGPEGYLYAHEKPTRQPHHELRITDVTALTPRAARRILAFLADHRSMAEHAVWHGGPADPITQLLPEIGYSAELSMGHWMIRITHVEAALAQRGYLQGVEAELHLDVHDPLVPENHGRYVLRVAGGKAEVRRGGRGRIKMDIRGLAPLYTGHLSAPTLAQIGLLEGPPADLTRAATVFAGPSPWTPDGF